MVPRIIATAIPIRTLVEDFFIELAQLQRYESQGPGSTTLCDGDHFGFREVDYFGIQGGPILVEIGPVGFSNALFTQFNGSINGRTHPSSSVFPRLREATRAGVRSMARNA